MPCDLRERVRCPPPGLGPLGFSVSKVNRLLPARGARSRPESAVVRAASTASRVACPAATVPRMPTARVNGITMYYEQHGAGEPLLLINGLGADMTLLAPLIAWFARSHRVVAFDNRGAGRT